MKKKTSKPKLTEAKAKVNVEAVVMCQYFGCDKPATLKIIRANTNLCDDHYLANVLRFGCVDFETKPVNTKEQGT